MSKEQALNETRKLSETELLAVTGGSATSGIGAGKAEFNPFRITRTLDQASPKLFL